MSLRSTINKPHPAQLRTADRQQRVLDLLAERGPMIRKRLRDHFSCSASSLNDTLNCLMESGDVAAWRVKGSYIFGLRHQAPEAIAHEDDVPPDQVGRNGELQEMVGNDPTHRVIRFTNHHKPGKGLSSKVSGLNGHSSLERV